MSKLTDDFKLENQNKDWLYSNKDYWVKRLDWISARTKTLEITLSNLQIEQKVGNTALDKINTELSRRKT